MFYYLTSMSLFLLTMSIYVFVTNNSHLLNSLLSLEMMSVTIYFLIGSIFTYLGLEMYYLLFFLIMVVCEGVLGLSLLISLVSSHGEDYFKLFNFMQC
uniref:NADH-ubiquinone oxidoreductase chain 4L n=2 Tax=Hyalella TaxID=199487 RepID=A0A7T8V735_9CRUS|nr:NADH dehydrogenase subunit 4L [Hyalella kochi]QQQ88733.1 NADH dehydrogenase subunit 4L [Hyalella sp. 2015-x]